MNLIFAYEFWGKRLHEKAAFWALNYYSFADIVCINEVFFLLVLISLVYVHYTAGPPRFRLNIGLIKALNYQ
jgi:hypothetical protein